VRNLGVSTKVIESLLCVFHRAYSFCFVRLILVVEVGAATADTQVINRRNPYESVVACPVYQFL
jgi:hypothetical protein